MIPCFGIDPAPSKETVVCTRVDGSYRFDSWAPHEVKSKVASLAKAHERLIITWDAPLGLDRSGVDGATNFASRAIDSAVIRWLKEAVDRNRLVAKAVGVANAASCPHNLLTQHVWGLPVGTSPQNDMILLRPNEPRPEDRILAEVHPAVSLAAWWTDDERSEPMPRYKRGGSFKKADTDAGLDAVIDFLVARFGSDFPRGAISDGKAGAQDDRLDAWIAWRMASDFTNGAAQAFGPPRGGSYLLPDTERLRDLASWQ